MKIHLEGEIKDFSLSDELSGNYDLDFELPDSLPFEEEGDVIIPNVSVRLYFSRVKTTLEEAKEGFLHVLFGDLLCSGQEYGYSEFTVEGFSVTKVSLIDNGKTCHNIEKIIKDNRDEYGYVHVLLESE